MILISWTHCIKNWYVFYGLTIDRFSQLCFDLIVLVVVMVVSLSSTVSIATKTPKQEKYDNETSKPSLGLFVIGFCCLLFLGFFFYFFCVRFDRFSLKILIITAFVMNFSELLCDWDLPILEAILQLWSFLLWIQEIVRRVSWWKHPFQQFHLQWYYFRRMKLFAHLVMLKRYQHNHHLLRYSLYIMRWNYVVQKSADRWIRENFRITRPKQTWNRIENTIRSAIRSLNPWYLTVSSFWNQLSLPNATSLSLFLSLNVFFSMYKTSAKTVLRSTHEP